MMDWPAHAFVKASLTWLALGVTLGVAMAVHPTWTVYHPAHEHMNLLGFVTMMIYGVAYHVIPRFTGNPLRRRWLAVLHWWIANAGLASMVTGFALRVTEGIPVAASGAVLGVGGVLSALGAYAFALNVWQTIDGRRGSQHRAAQAVVAAPTEPIKMTRRAR
jgi:cbb3-type cytochrome oxidase subunit 1